MDYVNRVTPYVEPGINTLFGESEGETCFTDEYWNDYSVPAMPLEYGERLEFYFTKEDEKIPGAELQDIYSELRTTPFVSLYSYLSWAEDLAEYCTMYHLTQNLGLTYTVRVLRDGLILLEYEPFGNPIILQRARHLSFLGR